MKFYLISSLLTLCLSYIPFIGSEVQGSRASHLLPEPYNTVELLPFDNHGWYGNGKQITEIVKLYKVKTVVEVGCWLGLSTRHIASILPKDGKVYAVDHWLGSEEHQEGKYAYHPILDRLYQQFLSNIIHAGLTDKIVPLRMDSLTAAPYLSTVLTNPPDLIYIDASHDTKSVYDDMCAWYPLIKGYGVLCGDDWAWASVQKAVRRFAQENKLRINASGNFWSLSERK